MPAEEATTKMRIAVSDILSSFQKNYWGTDGRLGSLFETAISELSLYDIADVGQFRSELSKKDDIEWMSQKRFVSLERIEDQDILPFMTLQSSNKWQDFSIYVLLTLIDNTSKFQCMILRFEAGGHSCDENAGIGKHDFFHTQFCRTIHTTSQVIVKASTPEWLPTSQPSFPLDADNHASLALCMLTSLYGGAHVRSQLQTTGYRNLKCYLQKVRALKTKRQEDG